MSLRDKLLSGDEFPTDTFDVEGWGSITIRMMSGLAREALESRARAWMGGKPDQHFRAAAIVYSVVDPETNQLAFNHKDIPALSAKSGKILQTVFARISAFNGMDKDESAAGDEFEELEKN